MPVALTALAAFMQISQTPSAGRWVLQPARCQLPPPWCWPVSNPISGEVGAAAPTTATRSSRPLACFKPHQRGGGCCSHRQRRSRPYPEGGVSNPISGEVGAAAWANLVVWDLQEASFKPHQRGGGCCSSLASASTRRPPTFQTPSAGRWVLQLVCCPGCHCRVLRVSNPISGEVGAAAKPPFANPHSYTPVSNPISGEVGAAASVMFLRSSHWASFQTPSAGRWVLQPVLSATGSSAITICFKPHQRGGGCCSPLREGI